MVCTKQMKDGFFLDSLIGYGDFRILVFVLRVLLLSKELNITVSMLIKARTQGENLGLNL
jgi:hypothetical protein